ncbi:LOW QUALITY PROTEIN: phosphoinositide 3-kinase adapter protein 1-like [Pristis pectinata]|uniref:LOW QUALITY PROTEIN: phosphoinositide 3-kinase adapter protein 1-like n=1 Tax=Pristis pectinata TaxID=685728 RepID=UPI00223D8470|nr:LOW QUALITY PROTEIN: phosphoinositide 3-kinase adapter protein 1-like [Pristis pectinata]
MSASGQMITPDVVILNAEDASEWTDYLVNLLTSSHHLEVLPYSIGEDTSFTSQDCNQFKKCKCLLVVLSPQLLDWIVVAGLECGLHKVLRPAHKVVMLFCGAVETPELWALFRDWRQWRQLSCDDEPESFAAAVEEAITESNSRDSGLDTTESEGENLSKVQSNLAKSTEVSRFTPPEEHRENMVKVLPERIQCGVPQQVFVILKVKLDSKIKNEMDFALAMKMSVRVPALFVNEYTLSANAPDMPPGLVSLTIYSGDLKICSATLIYYTDMEEIENLLNNAINPVEFMCQAFHIIPYNRETLDKLLTESLRRNMPANGLHIFGINQLEEDDLSTTQRDKELPTLLHFAAMYGLKNLTALLLQCPGALQAYSVANKDGDYPNNIAEKNGYRDLRQFMDEYVETADMLKTHLKEELCGNMEGEENEDLYESMATVTKDILMKCSLNPGCDEDIYESMMEMLPPSSVMESTYESMSNISGMAQSAPHVPDPHGPTKDSILRSFLQGTVECDASSCGREEETYDTMIENNLPQEIVKRPPAPNPRVPIVPNVDDMQPYISKVFCSEEKRVENIYITPLCSAAGGHPGPALPPRSKRPLSRAPSSDYDPFAGMKTPGQRQLITLQEQVKLGMINVDEALLQFKEWQLNQKRRSDSFRFQQENLKKLRDSITRRQNVKGRLGKHRGSLSSRSSTRSVLSLSSGAEGDNEDNEPVTCGRLNRQRPPSLPPPRIPPRGPARSPNQPSAKPASAPPVPPRGR